MERFWGCSLDPRPVRLPQDDSGASPRAPREAESGLALCEGVSLSLHGVWLAGPRWTQGAEAAETPGPMRPLSSHSLAARPRSPRGRGRPRRFLRTRASCISADTLDVGPRFDQSSPSRTRLGTWSQVARVLPRATSAHSRAAGPAASHGRTNRVRARPPMRGHGAGRCVHHINRRPSPANLSAGERKQARDGSTGSPAPCRGQRKPWLRVRPRSSVLKETTQGGTGLVSHLLVTAQSR